jgi:hypothetical protein
MSEQEVCGENYRVRFQADEAAIYFEGSLRLPMKTYKPITELLERSFASSSDTFTMDFRQLTFLNSSGINIVLRFVIALRRRGNVDLEVRGLRSIHWQTKSLMSIKKFLPKARIVLT